MGGWEHFFLNDLTEYVDFFSDAEHLVLPVFDTATGALEIEWSKVEASYRQSMASASDEGERGMLSQEWDWAEDLHRQRLQSIGAMALDWLMSSLQTALRSVKRSFKTSHPAAAKYNGDGWLLRTATEFEQRFKIDFKSHEKFERVQELVLARNAGIHRDVSPDEYLEKMEKIQKRKPAFVDDEDRFFVTREALVLVINDCREFLEWVCGELKIIQKRQG